MLRSEIDEKYGEGWWKRQYNIEIGHTVKMAIREIDTKIKEILKFGVIYKDPKKKKRYVCVSEINREYLTLIFAPCNKTNFILTGFSSNPEQIEMFKKIRGEING